MVGKTEFAYNLILHRSTVYNVKFDRILYCLPEDNLHLHADFIKRLRTTCENIEIVEGLPCLDKLHMKIDKSHKLIVIDDLVTKALASTTILQVKFQCIITCFNIT